jgi:hypothetical protein
MAEHVAICVSETRACRLIKDGTRQKCWTSSRCAGHVSHAISEYWHRLAGYNCFGGGRGAADLERAAGTAAPNVSTLVGCQRACADLQGCAAIVVSPQGGTANILCQRRGPVELALCDTNALLFDLYYISRGLVKTDAGGEPVPQPALPPRDVAAALNERFREGRATDDIGRAGVLLRQFDEAGFVETKARRGKKVGIVKPLALAWDPWLPCPDHHWCAARHLPHMAAAAPGGATCPDMAGAPSSAIASRRPSSTGGCRTPSPPTTLEWSSQQQPRAAPFSAHGPPTGTRRDLLSLVASS